MSTLTVGEVAKLTGVPASTLRFYERRGLIPAPPRSGGRRRYNPSILERIKLIAVAKAAGFTVTEIGALVRRADAGTPPARLWAGPARAKRAELATRMSAMQRMQTRVEWMSQCQCPSITACLRFVESRSALT